MVVLVTLLATVLEARRVDVRRLREIDERGLPDLSALLRAVAHRDPSAGLPVVDEMLTILRNAEAPLANTRDDEPFVPIGPAERLAC